MQGGEIIFARAKAFEDSAARDAGARDTGADRNAPVQNSAGAGRDSGHRADQSSPPREDAVAASAHAGHYTIAR